MVVILLQQHSPHVLPGEFGHRISQHHPLGTAHLSLPHFSAGLQKGRCWGRRRGTNVGVSAFWQNLSSKPAMVEMEPIKDMEHFDEVLQRSWEDDNRAVVFDWMAAWCRKCIYLKPKLEKLATEFPKIKFYSVDVNNVSQALVKRGNISKMPTIQLWKEGEMKAEVIGGHKAWLVVEEVRKMIKKHG